ncbi:hypothetical protein B8V57_03200 [Streptococcus agalactiae]|nr:hypothetical protein A6J68_01080 [Streptococcus sp. 'group B']ASA95287.1 hypothetical protein BB162_10895 [Streptococcus agalactiae]AWZ37147.1 hypothetical protein CCZ24_10615 [Streptococcus agalactiae]KAA9056977.1 hypothetical protein F5G76_00040 [Streptococcus agalactiae]KAA9062647.1 hypothetical protein F5G80_00040 [Streptococcus agalactiae]
MRELRELIALFLLHYIDKYYQFRYFSKKMLK